MDYEKKYKEACERAKELSKSITGARYDYIFPELKESEDERIRKMLYGWVCSEPDSTFDGGYSKKDVLAWLEKQKETLSETFKESEQEKRDFVGDGFIQCKAGFQDFKENNNYWLEYLGDDNYNVRSDNLLGKTYHITPCQLYTIFKKLTWLEKTALSSSYHSSNTEKIEQKPVERSEEDDTFLKKEFPKEMLSDELFNKLKDLNKPQGLKFIRSNSTLGLKESAIYYDLYVKDLRK